MHAGIQRCVKDLNHLYRSTSALHYDDFDSRGFEWIDCHDAEQSVVSYMRKTEGSYVVVVLNFTPVPRYHYRIGVPQSGTVREVFNSDSAFYAGSNLGNLGEIATENIAWMNRPHSIQLTLPPLGGIVLQLNQHG